MSDLKHGSLQSPDGTEIAFVRLGHGPSLVIVHGSLVSGESWMPVARILANRFTCLVMDRRGHGRSGDSLNYAIEREYEDIETVLGAAEPNASLIGHSYGAICALGAATRSQLTHLVLYEPPLPVNGSIAGSALLDYKKAIESDNLHRALEIGLTKFAGVTSEQIQTLRRSSVWPGMVALAPTWTREVEAVDSLGPSLSRYREFLTPTLLLSGTLSPKHPLQNAVVALSVALQNCEVSWLEGQGHSAHSLAPKQFAERVASFLLPR